MSPQVNKLNLKNCQFFKFVKENYVASHEMSRNCSHYIPAARVSIRTSENNQKIIEETPSQFISEKVRQEMYAQCVSLAKQVGYFSAKKIEPLLAKKNHYNKRQFSEWP
jgi:biotin carboxylase